MAPAETGTTETISYHLEEERRLAARSLSSFSDEATIEALGRLLPEDGAPPADRRESLRELLSRCNGDHPLTTVLLLHLSE